MREQKKKDHPNVKKKEKKKEKKYVWDNFVLKAERTPLSQMKAFK